MHNFQLPDPQKTASFGQARETLESIVSGRPTIRPDHALPPILHNPFEQQGLVHTTEMERRLSLSSSAYTSGQSAYTPSRSTSPTGFPSPQLSGDLSRVMSFQQPSHANHRRQSATIPHCPGCHIVVEAGQVCTECGTINVERHSAGEGSRKKRKDRRECLQMSKDGSGMNKTKMSKDKTEAGRRLKHTIFLGQLQKQLEHINPKISAEASGGKWKALKKNNMSEDCADPLTVNKEDIYMSTLQVTADTELMLEDILEERNILVAEASALLQIGLPPAATAFVRRVVHDQWVQRVVESAHNRGTGRFRRPLPAALHSSSRL